MSTSYTTKLRDQFEKLFYERLQIYGIGVGTRTPRTYGAYHAFRQLDSALNGKVYNSHRLSMSEYNRLVVMLNRLLPENPPQRRTGPTQRGVRACEEIYQDTVVAISPTPQETSTDGMLPQIGS